MKRLLLALMVTLPLAAQPQLKVFSLSNRPAAATLEPVRALLQPGETVMAEERLQRLIVRAAPERLEQIQKLLEQIDVAAPQVWITIAQSANNPYSGGGLLQTYNGQQNVNSSQQLLVMSGEKGSVTVGEDIPQVQPFWTYVNGLGLLPPGVVFQRVTTGFSVEPTVIGQNIRLRLTPWMSYQSAQGPGRIDFSEGSTSVTMKNGETLTVATGGTSNSRQSAAFGLIMGYGNQQSASNNQLIVTTLIRDEPPPIPQDPSPSP
ncbi:MAG: secretin N-terminal domain-containing protein [Vulcanimicrobiota bacterium]